MKKVLLVLVMLLLPQLSYSNDIPRPKDWVSDFAGVVSDEYRGKIISIIQELRQKTSTEIMVITVDSIAPQDEKSYARMIFDSWKPGKKGKDNGVLVLLAVKERRWRIEAGYGIEGILPDGRCGAIGRTFMVPYLRMANTGKAFITALPRLPELFRKMPK